MKQTLLLSALLVMILTTSVFAEFTPGNLFVVNAPSSRSAGNDYIDQYTPSGENLGHIIGPELGIKGIREVIYDPGTGHLLYTVNTWQPKVFEIREIDSSGNLVQVYTHENFGSGNIELVFGKDHTLYIANSGDIYRRQPGETELSHFITLPINPAYGYPIGVGDLEIDSQGNLYLSDPFVNDKIFKFFPDGRVEIFADGEDGLNGPYGLAMDSNDNLYAGNTHGSNQAIVKINPSGQGQTFVSHGTLPSGPHDLAFDDQGFLLAACRNANTILRFDNQGIGENFPGTGVGVSDPSSIAFIPSSCQTDFDADLDVDGLDLARFADGYNGACIQNFSMVFGTGAIQR